MINVDGFLFEDEETAQQAHKEEEGVHYIKEHTALNNSEVVLKLYNTLLEQELFVTPVGIRFLVELQNILLSSKYIAKDEITPIPVKAAEVVQKEEVKPLVKKSEETPKKVENKKDSSYKKAYHVALFFAIVLGVSVIGMFVINAISGNNVNIINYKEQILNEYSSWEAELKAEEKRLEEWEESLEEREAQLNGRE